METLLSNVIVPQLWTPYMQERTALQSRLWASGIIVADPVLSAKLKDGGDTINMPFWQDLTGTSQTIKSNSTLSVNGITTSKDIARKQQRANAWGAEDLAKQLAGSDPAAAVADLVGDWWGRDMQVNLQASLRGIFGSGTMSGNTHDIFKVTGTPDATNYLTAQTFIAAGQKMGANKVKLTAIVMHSMVEATLAVANLIDYVQESDGSPFIKKFQGFEVIIDDNMDTEVVDGKTVFHTYLFGKGAFGFAESSYNEPVEGGKGTWNTEFDRVALNGISRMISRREFILHPRGIKWTENTVGFEFPDNTELATAANWSRVYEQQNIRIVRIRHNVPEI